MANGTKPHRQWIGWICFLIVAGLAGYALWSRLLREEPLVYGSALESFKYGSIGTEQDGLRVPYLIWLALPRMFPEYLPGPGGYAALGFAWEEGRELPIGLPKRTLGQPMVGINCALCHTATVRETRYDKPVLYVGAPAHQLDVQGYFRFLFACASDPRFNADNILGALAPVYDMGFLDRLLYRYVLIPQTRRGLLEFKQRMAWTDTRPAWGRGRIDPFNPAKFAYLGLPVDDTVGNSKMESVWNMSTRVDHGYVYHWDGLLHGPLQDVVVSSALGDSTTPRTLPLSDLKRVESFLLTAPVARYPFAVDQALASRGSPIYQKSCAGCHAVGGARTGKVIPLAEVGTDRHRADSWSQKAADAYNAYARSYPWKLGNFQKSDGYAAVLLDGIWVKAPYLHNGSVPTLADLLAPEASRPKQFWSGYDVYDQEKVGYVTAGDDARRNGSLLDVGVPGNGNSGHLWGTALSADEKKALLEYMKTL